MDRREFIAHSSVAAAIFLAGCNGSDDSGSQNNSGGSTTDSPATVVRGYLQTLYDGTVSEINAFFHPNSETPKLTETQAQQYQSRSIEIRTVETQNTEGDTAEVTASVTVETSSREIDDTATYELRKSDGDWKIYQINP